MKTRLLAAGAIAAVSLGAPSFGTFAQEKYPSRPVQVLVPVSSGTTADIVARMYPDRLSQRLGQQFVVLNRQGAGGTIAELAEAEGDALALFVRSLASREGPPPFDPPPITLAALVAQGRRLVAEQEHGMLLERGADRPELARREGPRDVDAGDLRAEQRMDLVDFDAAGVAHGIGPQSMIAW